MLTRYMTVFSALQRLFAVLLLACLLPAQAQAATQQENLHSAIKEFEAMMADKNKGMWRDTWEKLEKRFATVQGQGQDFAPEAFFYRARSLEELADRSKSKSDYSAASKLYAEFTDKYSRHALADNAAFNQAMMLSGPLQNKTEALRVLDRLILLYPDSDILPEALALRERLQPTSAPSRQNSGSSAASRGNTPQGRPAAEGLQTQKTLYENAAAQWRTLLSNKDKAKLRDNWLNLEADFKTARDAAPQGPDAHKAAYQVARCREELAERSMRREDWALAAEYFAEAAKAYPTSSLADDSLYAQAEVLIRQLSERNEGRQIAAELVKRYPNGDMKAKAEKLLKDFPASQTATGTPARSAAPVERQSATAAKIEGSSGSRSIKAPASGAILRYMEWSGDSEKATLVLELAGRAKYRRLTLPANAASKTTLSARIELAGTDMARNLRQSVMLTGLPVASINLSRQSGGSLRADLDLTNARSYKVTVLDNPYRLKIDISANTVLPGAEDLQKPAPHSAQGASNGNIAEHLGLDIKTVVIDAGHGGKDPGAVGNRLRESSITLDLAKRLGAQLGKQGFNVIYTRETDRYVALENRTSHANSKRADIFISIHVNASTNKSLSGLETYYLDVARSDAASVVAARENAVNVNATSDLQFILSDLTRNVKKEESLAVSRLVHKAALKQLGQSGFKMRDNGVRSAPFHVLMGARMPAFLIEVGYISNSSDAARLSNAKYIQNMAEGICDGIVAYRKQINAMTAR